MIKLENAWTKSFENPSENMSFQETSFIINANIYCPFSYAGIWELVNLFSGQKILTTIFVMKTGRKHNKIL